MDILHIGETLYMQDLILSMVSGIHGSFETHPPWIKVDI